MTLTLIFQECMSYKKKGSEFFRPLFFYQCIGKSSGKSIGVMPTLTMTPTKIRNVSMLTSRKTIQGI
jgi:hypothetical protein